MASSAPSAAIDPRRQTRVAAHRVARLLGGTGAWDCVILDRSIDGARLRLAAAAATPDHLQLIDLIDGVVHEARAVWRKDRELGVQILASHDLRGLIPARLRAAKRVWAAGQARASAS